MSNRTVGVVLAEGEVRSKHRALISSRVGSCSLFLVFFFFLIDACQNTEERGEEVAVCHRLSTIVHRSETGESTQSVLFEVSKVDEIHAIYARIK